MCSVQLLQAGKTGENGGSGELKNSPPLVPVSRVVRERRGLIALYDRAIRFDQKCRQNRQKRHQGICGASTGRRRGVDGVSEHGSGGIWEYVNEGVREKKTACAFSAGSVTPKSATAPSRRFVSPVIALALRSRPR